MLDGQIILKTSSDVVIFNLGLHFEGPNHVWMASKTSILNTAHDQQEDLDVGFQFTQAMDPQCELPLQYHLAHGG